MCNAGAAARLMECGLGRKAVSHRTDLDIADAVSAISAAPDPKACSRIFRKAIAAFNIDAFASGEIDLTALERTVFYAIGWPDTWHKFYVGTGVILRDPVIAALKQRHGPFTWSELRQDGKYPAAGTKVLQVIAEHGWTEGLAVPIPSTLWACQPVMPAWPL